ncbi:MAG TPA: hypothetical protein VHQ47_12960 [Phycisphaerae bacterium]|nr:hypothetical protein [Phycisphaerae bacterium]
MEDGTLSYRRFVARERLCPMGFFTWIWLVCGLTVGVLHVACEFAYRFTDPHTPTRWSRWLEEACLGFMLGDLMWGIFSVSLIFILLAWTDGSERGRLVMCAVICLTLLMYESRHFVV